MVDAVADVVDVAAVADIVDVDVDGGQRLELETFPGERFRVVDLPDVDLGAVSGQGFNTFVPL